MTPSILTPLQARVLGTLMEKARTVPDSYPLTLNNVLNGCNQKTSRDPVMNVDEAQAQDALDALKTLGVVREASGQRSARYEHNFQRHFGVPEQSAVLLGLLMLRGAQTAGELRISTERWYRFADISSVEGFLDELQERSDEKGGPLVVKLARSPGAREQRWAHLLCGAEMALQSAAAGQYTDPTHSVELQQRVLTLEDEVRALRETVRSLCTELGLPLTLSPPGQNG
jgi:uncharacterized protein YceH (UPF0502 family)